MFRRQACGGAEKWLFDTHPVWGTVLVMWILELPWLICFFPGSIEPDACRQLRMFYGIEALTAHHPIAVTRLMGTLVEAGRAVFGSDVMGVFLYTFLQFAIQSLVIAYVIYVMKCMETPILARWLTLAFYGIFPLFPMWGYTMVKDSGYYIFMLLLVTALVHMLHKEETRPKRYQIVLLLLGLGGVCFYRKDGSCVAVCTLVFGIIMYRRYRKLFFCMMTLCLSAVLLTNIVHSEIEDIPSGPVRESLSVPLQQTARYIREHYNEITPEEMRILQELFLVDVAEVVDLYNPELADPVKDWFVPYPTISELNAYLGVWWQQLLKRPDTYVQAFINHMYGYICPDKMYGWEGEDIGVFDTTTTELEMDLEYAIKNEQGRYFLERYSRTVKRLPVVGMLYSPGVHTWIMLGCILYLMQRRKWRKLLIYIPGCCIWLICILSPVNACTRYSLPLIALLPLHLLWAAEKKIPPLT